MNKILGASWQPKVAGIVSAFFSFVLFSPDLFTAVPWLVAIAKYGLFGGLVAFGVVVKAYNVTGGTALNDKMAPPSQVEAALKSSPATKTVPIIVK
jgi:hypothetical protein